MDCRRSQIVNTMVHKQQILVSREDLDASIMDCRVYVRFLGEQGDDMDDLTREFYSSFWVRFANDHIQGESSKYFCLTPQFGLSDEQLLAAGRILIHGFVLTGYLPIHVSYAQLFLILTGRMPSSSLSETSFLATLTDSDQQKISLVNAA